MLIFDQLRISDNAKRLYINVHVNFAKEFDNIMLDSITIIPAIGKDGELQVSETSPDIPTENYIYKKVYTEDLQVDHIVIDKGVLDAAFNNWNGSEAIDATKPHAKMSYSNGDFSNDLFFVFVKCKGTPGECTPCRLDEEITLGVTFYEAKFHQAVMQNTRELNRQCDIPKNFLDLILLWNGFKSAIETEHYMVAVDYWKKLFGGRNGIPALGTTKPCGCHG